MKNLKIKFLFIFILLLTLSCNGGNVPEKPNVILIIVDTLRADHLSCYDYERNTSPAIDSIAKGGIQFLNAYTTAPWTQPAVASIITGLLPYYHNVCDLFDILSPDNITLAELLRDEGYKTGAVISHKLLESKLGYAQGFDYYNEDNVGDESTVSSDKVTGNAVKWIDNNKKNDFFLMLHYFDPHYAYEHHEDFDYSTGYEGELKAGDDIWDLRSRKDNMSNEDLSFLKNLYDEEISFTDKNIGILIQYLKDENLFDKSIIVITADHGEEFNEHGWLGHTVHLYEELVHVPLLIHIPGNEYTPKKIKGNVSVADIVPTILELLDIGYDKSVFNGKSLSGKIKGENEIVKDNPVFFQITFALNEEKNLRAKQKFSIKNGVLLGKEKLIYDIANEVWELYDISSDKSEKSNISTEKTETYKQLKSYLEKSPIREQGERGLSKGANKLTPSKKDVESLKSLGYLQ